jgi:hypothetical protein
MVNDVIIVMTNIDDITILYQYYSVTNKFSTIFVVSIKQTSP